MIERVATQRIIALGGGGFLMEPDNPKLDDYVLAATGKPRPRILFVPTASGDSLEGITRFYSAFARKAEASHLGLFRRTVADVRALVLAQDVVYVGGGNTANMLAVWPAHELDDILREAYAAGVVLAGVSAGAVCWFHGCVTDSFGALAGLQGGLGLLPGALCPHYDGEAMRAPALATLLAAGELPETWAVDDGCALDFEGGELRRVVSSRPTGGAYRVRWTGSAIETDPLEVERL